MKKKKFFEKNFFDKMFFEICFTKTQIDKKKFSKKFCRKKNFSKKFFFHFWSCFIAEKKNLMREKPLPRKKKRKLCKNDPCSFKVFFFCTQKKKLKTWKEQLFALFFFKVFMKKTSHILRKSCHK